MVPFREDRGPEAVDPVGDGAERCIAAFYYAKTQNRHYDFLLEAGKAIFSEAIDVATDEGMQIVAERAGLFWPELQEGMKNDEWRHEAKKNREILSEAAPGGDGPSRLYVELCSTCLEEPPADWSPVISTRK